MADIDRVARQLKLSRASVYRLLHRFRQQLLATALLPNPPGRKTGRVLLPEAQERILRQTIEAFYLTPQRPSIAALYRAVCLNCQLAKTEAPSYKTVRARVRGIDFKRRTRLRDGPKAAAGKFRPVRGALKKILVWYHGIKPQPPPACFVTWQGTAWVQTGVFGAPTLNAKVKHPGRPTVLQPTAIDTVLWKIL